MARRAGADAVEDRTDLADDRGIAALRALMERAYPDPETRQTCLTVLADSLEQAHAVSPTSWSLNPPKGEHRLRLNIGSTEACVLGIDNLYLVLDRDRFTPELHHLVDAEMAREEGRRAAPYRSTPFAYGARLPADRLETLLPLVLDAHRSFVERAARARPRTTWLKRQRPYAIAYLRQELGRDLPNPTDGKDTVETARWWVEKTQRRGSPYRLSGEFSVGKALILPTESANGVDVFGNAREVRPGDVVLHFTDREAVTGVSRVARPHEETATPPEVGWWTRWPRSYLIRLRDYRPLEPPLPRDLLFDDPYRERLVGVWNGAGGGLFYSGSERLNLRGGANYLTPAPPELVEVLRDAYASVADRDLVPEGWPTPDVVAPPPPPPSTLADLAHAAHLPEAEVAELVDLLRDKQQLVLEGPPGSGKTFLADLLARHLAGVALGGAVDEQVETVQFHQSYGYEDFVQGIRPVTRDGALHYDVVPGIFARLCARAAANPERHFVLVIDEINRGNLSRIFGELLLLLEYRGRSVRLPYAADGPDAAFSIPPNLFLIGTMNSTDRSLALIDYALRRRFYFSRLLPVRDGRAPVLEAWLARQPMAPADRARLLRLFVVLNERIEGLLAPDFQVGHSYFMRPDIATERGLERVWRHAVLPLLEEYFHGARDRRDALAEFAPDRLLAEAGSAEPGIVAPDPAPALDR